MGGLSRYSTVIEQQHTPGAPPAILVDTGDLYWKGLHISEGEAPQQKLKASLIAETYAAAGIDAMVPGEGDFAFGTDWLTQTAAALKLPYVAANLNCDGKAPFPDGRVIERDGMKVAIVGVLDVSLEIPGCTISDAAPAAEASFARLGDVDLRLLLSHSRTDQDIKITAVLPQVDLIINGHARATNDTPRSLSSGTLQLAAGSRGKHVGVATLTLTPGAHGFRASDATAIVAARLDTSRARLESAKQKAATADEDAAKTRAERQLKYYADEVERLERDLAAATTASQQPAHGIENTLVGLDAKIADQPATAARLEAAKAAVSALEEAAAQTPTDAVTAFVGAESCKSCHPGPYAQWSGTAHARAWDTLKATNNQNDRACYSCHATGVGAPGGPSAPSQVGALAGVQCESCHGPAAEHLVEQKKAQLLPRPPAQVCTQCHDGEQDGGRFEAGTYMAKISHGTYASPPAAGANK